MATASASNSSNQLNFYESMYHFKKMFPKFDSEVIETVLRSNDGSVDQTIDQLLTMSFDYDSNEIANVEANNLAENQFNNLSANNPDLPPSYESFMSSKFINQKTAQGVDLKYNRNLNSSKIQENEITINSLKSIESPKTSNVVLIEDLVVSNPNSSLITSNKLGSNFTIKLDSCEIIDPFKSICDRKKHETVLPKSSESLSSRLSKILIGELSKDFLRVKLTNEQVKKIKYSIKKAKRNELTAILNNKQPEKPELSFEIKKKFDILSDLNIEDSSNESSENSESCGTEKWKARYEDMTKTYDKRRLQIMQDEYIAKLIQNEEFLTELKQNKDFIQTLNHESNSIRLSSGQPSSTLNNETNNTIMSNAELKSKLSLMGKVSRAKLSKLAIAFINKAKNKYNKAMDQTSNTCISLFTNFNTLKSIDYPSSTNGSYYVANETSSSSLNGKKSLELIKKNDLEFVKSFDKDDTIKLRNDGSYKLEEFETYDLEKIKAEEYNSKFDTFSKNNKCKKVYRSFKTAMKRNSSASSSSSSSIGSSASSNMNSNKNFNQKTSPTPNKTEISQYDSDIFKNQLPKISWTSNNNSKELDLIAFKDEYSYDDYSNRNSNFNYKNVYSYDQSNPFK